MPNTEPWSWPPHRQWPPPWPWRPIPVVFFIVRRHNRRVIRFAELISNGRIIMNPVTVNVGHTVSMSIEYLDANGNPMLVTPVPDSAPTWTDTTPATGTLTVAAGGLTATELAVEAGSDLVNLSLTVGGVSFAASLGITVTAAPQVLTSIAIEATVN
jgi:hypothetical protein